MCCLSVTLQQMRVQRVRQSVFVGISSAKQNTYAHIAMYKPLLRE